MTEQSAKHTNISQDLTQLEGVEIIQRYVQTLGHQSGVYRMLDSNQQVLYVGKARQLRTRVQSYTRIHQLSRRIALMVSLTRGMEFVQTHTEAEALLLEAELIKRLKPRFNILLRDDKSYPEILLRTDHQFPMLSKHRGKHSTKGLYFGPYAHVRAVNMALDELQKIFLLRTCTDSVFANRSRPCLLYDMKRCSAPCVGKVSAEEYAQQIHQASEFLHGRTHHLQAQLAQQMQQASQALEYEKAAKIRDRLAALTEMQQRHSTPAPHSESADVLALASGDQRSCVGVMMFRHGRYCGTQTFFVRHSADQKNFGDVLASFLGQFYQTRAVPRLLLLNQVPAEASLVQEALSRRANHSIEIKVPKRGDKYQLIVQACADAQSALDRHVGESKRHQQQWQQLEKMVGVAELNRVEAFDNSHFGGSQPVGVMVVADQDGFVRKEYRKFNIRGSYAQGDDYAFMHEVLTRRLKALRETRQAQVAIPDLMLIDGGRGQLSVARKVMRELSLEHKIIIAGVVKGPGRDTAQDRLILGENELCLSEYSESGLLVQRLRDEAHRFAIGSQKVRRKGVIRRNALDEIPDIGAKRKRLLLQHFGSVKAVSGAGVADISAIEGISNILAQKIYAHFR